jgi:hypothetical protein
VSTLVVLLLWWIPTALVLATGLIPALRRWRAPVWIACFTLMGLSCIWAATYGYVHCYITAPVYLLAAAATVIDAAGIRRIAWQHILVGAIIASAIANAIERLTCC